jgi:hypothetical protein
MKKEYSFTDKDIVSMIRLSKTQTALVIDSKGEATMHFGRDAKGQSKLQWPELLLASVFVALGEKDVATITAAMKYTSKKLKAFEKETKNAKRKEVRVHCAGHKQRR